MQASDLRDGDNVAGFGFLDPASLAVTSRYLAHVTPEDLATRARGRPCWTGQARRPTSRQRLGRPRRGARRGYRDTSSCACTVSCSSPHGGFQAELGTSATAVREGSPRWAWVLYGLVPKDSPCRFAERLAALPPFCVGVKRYILPTGDVLPWNRLVLTDVSWRRFKPGRWLGLRMLRNPGDGLAKADLLPRGFGHHGFAILVGLLALPGVAAANTITVSFPGQAGLTYDLVFQLANQIAFPRKLTPPNYPAQSVISNSDLTLDLFSPAISFLSITANYSVSICSGFSDSSVILGTGAGPISGTVGSFSCSGSSAGSSIAGPDGLAIRLSGAFDGSNLGDAAAGANASERWRFTLAQTEPVTLEFSYFGFTGETGGTQWTEPTLGGRITVSLLGGGTVADRILTRGDMTQIPEPGTVLLMMTGLLGPAFAQWRRA